MAHGRMGIGVALLFVLGGTAAAQPVPAGGAGPLAPGQPPGAPPPLFPSASPAGGPSGPVPALIPSGSPSGASSGAAPGGGVQPLSFAEDHGPLRELPGGLGELVPPPDKHELGDHTIPEYLTPFAPAHRGWYADGEFLLMRARSTDMDYAITGSNVGLGTVGPIDTLNFKLSAGLRTEVGYRFGDQGKWEAAFGYTYFGDHGGVTTVAGPGQVLFPTLTRPGLTDTALAANVSTTLDYQLFDLIVARRVVVDDNFAVRAIGGFRFADIRQSLNASYNGDDARQDSVYTGSRFQGFGPIVGLESVLGGWHGFHLYSKASVGLLSGLNTNPLLETNDAGGTTYVNTTYNVRKVVPTGTVGIGGGWQYNNLSIRAGYEITEWNDIFERPRFTDDVTPGKIVTRPSNLTLEGLFIQVRYSF
jgi:hypothetical protein